METTFKSVVEKATSILVLLPKDPHLDQVASGLSLYLALKDKKNVTVTCPTPMIVEFNRLVGVNKITSESENKNLEITFNDYKADDVERVSWDIEGSNFKLIVIPNPGVLAPKKEQIQLSYSGFSADTIVLVGGGRKEDYPMLLKKDTQALNLVHIGNRIPEIPGILSFAKPASSLAELVYYLIKEAEISVNEDIASNLLAGIEFGSNHFRAEGVTADTFSAFADLMKLGGKRFIQAPQQPKGFQKNVPQQPQVQGQQKPDAPKDWLEPKIYKGTTIT